ncbi:MAG: DUF4255 domain-containing protein [Myxococcota bacterium]
MNRHRTVAAVTAAFGQLVNAAAEEAVPGATLRFERPDTLDPGPRVFLFMYQVSPNAAVRNLELPVRYDDGSAKQRPFLGLDLHYLLTFVGNESALEPQKMLGRVASTIHAYPVLKPEEIRTAELTAMEGPLIGDEDVPIVNVRFSPIGLNLEELSKVWSVFFQTPYGLSVAYRASVVLLEADMAIRPPLPAQRPRGRGELLANPIIAQVVSSAGLFLPIIEDSLLVITGKRLAGEQTLVRFATGDVEPDEITPARVTVTIPNAARTVGVQTVRIVKRPWDAAAGDASNEVVSNVSSFVLHPDVVGVVHEAPAKLTIECTPAIDPAAKVEALLDELDVTDPRSFRLAVQNFVDPMTLDFDTAGLPSGKYAVRLSVDGIVSAISIDTVNDVILDQVDL